MEKSFITIILQRTVRFLLNPENKGAKNALSDKKRTVRIRRAKGAQVVCGFFIWRRKNVIAKNAW
ncbi:MAG: hypothetical protein IJ370_03705, partial [Oscillospiraceae bacterium]|nr:hypothetical protein [Oscillospiraceae bacterium]